MNPKTWAEFVECIKQLERQVEAVNRKLRQTKQQMEVQREARR